MTALQWDDMTLLRKTWYDLWQDKSRTLQVVLVIALGAIGIGLTIGGRNLIAKSVLEGWQSSEPAHINLSVNPPLTGAELERLERIDGVWQAEGRYTSGVEWRIAGTEEWQTGVLNGRDDFREQKMALDGLLSGEWPERDTAGIGKISVGAPGVFEGDMVELRFGDTVRTVTVTGTLDPVGPTPVFGENFYVDGRTFTRITGRDTYDLIATRDQVWDPQRAEATDLAIHDYFDEINVDSVGVLFPFNERVIPARCAAGRVDSQRALPVTGCAGRCRRHAGHFPGLQQHQRHRQPAGGPDWRHESHRRRFAAGGGGAT